jgi:hypothetical protein
MKVINLYGGPGAGKSTTAAGLFNIMKTRGHNVELVTEVAKDLTWEKNWMGLGHQPSILAAQDYRLWRLEMSKVEWAISDSPLPGQIAYMGDEWLEVGLDDMAWDLYDRYENYHVLLHRGNREYQPIGRNQTALEAAKLDNVLDNIFHTAIATEEEFSLELNTHVGTCWEIYNWIVGET